MEPSLIYTFGIGLLIGFAVLAMFIWGIKVGAMENIEDAKYVMFRDEDDD
jgi:cbb3-type cytochrome oxidase maturation protein